MQQALEEKLKDAQAKELMYAEEANRLGKVVLLNQSFPCEYLICIMMCIYHMNRVFFLKKIQVSDNMLGSINLQISYFGIFKML